MNKSFTLIEILVVIVVIGILSAFILVGMNSITDSANIAKSQALSESIKNSLTINTVALWGLNGTTSAGSPATTNDIKDDWLNNNGILCTPGGIFTDPIPTVRSGSDCIKGSCLEFDNIDDQYYITENNDLKYMGQGMTLESWIKINSSATDRAYIFSNAWNGNGYYNYFFYWHTDSKLYFYLGGDVGQTKSISTTHTLSKNKWYHVIATTNTDKAMKIYVNGIVDSSDTHSITTWIPSLGGGDQNIQLSIGHLYRCDTSVPDRIFHGLMDELRFFKEAVPSSQIQQNYFTGLNNLYKNKGITKIEYGQRLTELRSNTAEN